jgi:NDP-sugar pyrophosphorylase family protein
MTTPAHNGTSPGSRNGLRAAILAGGRGTRLAPYTTILPKALMPIGDKAILEIVIGQLSAHGFTDITLCVGHLSHLIRAVFDTKATIDGSSVTYVHEAEALGTAGPLRLLEGMDDTFLAMNGDVLTTLDYRRLLEAHRRDGNAFTIATHHRTIKIDYGVLYTDDGDGTRRVHTYEEKPEIGSTVSMGIYAIEPEVLKYIPADYFDIPDLIQALLADGCRVGAFPYEGLWFDIGRHDDYERAVKSWEDNGNGHHPANGNGELAVSLHEQASRV